MANIDISQNKLEEATAFLIQYLRDSGFTGSTEAGTAIYDVLVRPSAILYTLFNDMSQRTKAYSSLESANEVRAEIGEDEYNSAVDSILQNWFVTRKEGNKSTGTVRLYFSRLLTYLELQQDGTPKIVINGVNYDVSRDYNLASSNFYSVYNSERNSIEYYTDVEVESIDNIAATAGAVVVNIGSIYLLRGVLLGDIISGKAYETSEEFIERTQQVITTRELISDNSIYTTLGEVFSGIRELYIAGYGDTEQLRDVVVFQDVDIHVGNKADIYLNIDFEVNRTSCYVGSSGTVDISQIGQHIADIIKVQHKLQTQGILRLRCYNTPAAPVVISSAIKFTPVSNGSSEYYVPTTTTIGVTDWLPCYNPDEIGVYYDLFVYSPIFEKESNIDEIDLNSYFVVPSALPMVADIVTPELFTNREITFNITGADRFTIGTVGSYITCNITELIGEISDCYIEYLSNSTFKDAWEYITDYSNRVVCYNPVIKSKFIIYLYCNVTISTINLSTAETIEAERLACVNAISTYINALQKDDVFSVYDMFVAINNSCSNIDRVKVPVDVSYRFQDPESFIYYTGSITDIFSLENVVLGEGESLSLMVSTNTFQYYINEDNINVTIDRAIY